MKSLAILLCVFSSFVSWNMATVVPVKDCGSVLASISQVDIEPCPKLPCPFKKNALANVTITFIANSAITFPITKITGIIGALAMPFPLPDENACHFMTCPINKGDRVVYTNSIFIPPTSLQLTLVVKWEIKTGTKEVVCFTVPVTLTD